MGYGASPAASGFGKMKLASSDRGPHAQRGGHGAWGGVPFK
jgi:hypothetical protein